jgi:hypothetical protein
VSSKPDTLKHRGQVIKFANRIATELLANAIKHDESKIQEPELSVFNEYTPKLKNSAYGSEEYQGYLKEMGKALRHHYQFNRHHPEHFKDGVCGMNLVDLVEMFCDWWAASLRHNDGDIRRSIVINQERFGYSDDVAAILLNTVDLLESQL